MPPTGPLGLRIYIITGTGLDPESLVHAGLYTDLVPPVLASPWVHQPGPEQHPGDATALQHAVYGGTNSVMGLKKGLKSRSGPL